MGATKHHRITASPSLVADESRLSLTRRTENDRAGAGDTGSVACRSCRVSLSSPGPA